MDLLLKLQEMEKNISQNSDVYSNAVLVGNAFYNMSHYGNSRVFYEGAIIGSDMCCVGSLDSAFVNMLTNMKLSEKYYQIALSAATTDEQKAKVTYLLAKCERNDHYNTSVPGGPWDEPSVYFAADHFKQLKQFSNTQYYKEVIKECGYFKSYLTGK
jgi:hypothetical protein